MRSYLLGTLEEQSSSLIEERYFTDRQFFLFVQAVETALIRDYLAGHLTPPLRSLFEARYLAVPDLRRRLEEVRKATLEDTRAPMLIGGKRALLAAAILLICVGSVSILLYRGRMGIDSLPPSGLVPPVLARISLSPGVLKGGVPGVVQVAPQTVHGVVLFLLEIPGGQVRSPYTAEVSRAQPDGRWMSIWSTSQPIWPTVSMGKKELRLRVAASLLVRGDYRVELAGPDGVPQDNYWFRVSPM